MSLDDVSTTTPTAAPATPSVSTIPSVSASSASTTSASTDISAPSATGTAIVTAAGSAGTVPARPSWLDPQTATTLAGLGLAGGLWWWSLSRFDLDAAGAVGIIGVAPWSYLAAIAVLAALFGYQLSRDQARTLPLALIVGALVVVLFSVPNLADGTAMTPTGYVHAGYVDYIGDHQEVLRFYDARFDWPAFFAAGSILTGLAGMSDALPLLTWAPLAFELLAMAPVLLIARCLVGRGRTAWLAVVLYYAGSWFSQDYFAPQALSHLLYVSSMAVLLWTAGGGSGGLPARRGGLRAFLTDRPQPPPGLSDRTALGIQLGLTGVLAAMVVTHQLTPIGFIIQLGVLSVLGATRYRALWLVGLLLFVLWFSYGAEDFWRGHLAGLVDNVGKVESSLDRGLTSRVSTGDPIYLRMQLVRTAWSGLFLLAGAVGGVVLLLRGRGRLAITVGALAVAPFTLIALQSYGGEIFLRCFLYAMPFLAVLCAIALSPLLRLPGPARAATVAGVVLAASLALVTTRGVNVAFERVSPDALAAARVVTAAGDRYPQVAVVQSFAPLGYADIDVQRVGMLGPDCETRLVACALEKQPDAILLSLEQEKAGRLREGLPEGWLMRDGVDLLVDAAGYRMVFSRPGAVVLEKTPQTPRIALSRAVPPAAAARTTARTAARTTARTTARTADPTALTKPAVGATTSFGTTSVGTTSVGSTTTAAPRAIGAGR